MADSGDVNISVKTKADKASAEAAGKEVAGTLSDATLAGLGGIDKKLAAIESGKGAIKVVADLKKGLAGLGDKESAAALNDIIDAFAKTMKGDIGTEEIAKLKEQIEGLDKVLKNLKSPWLEKIGPQIQKAQAAVGGFVKSVEQLPEKTKYAFDFKGQLMEAGLSVSTLDKNIATLITKLPGLGNIGAKAFGAITMGVSLAIAAVKALIEVFKKERELEENMRVNAHTDTADTIQKQYESRVNGINLEAKKRENLIDKIKMQEDATRALQKAQNDLADAQSRFGVRDAATLDELDIRKSERDSGREYDEKMAEIRNEEDRLNAEMEKLEALNANMNRRSERLKKENQSIARDAAAYFLIANPNADNGGGFLARYGTSLAQRMEELTGMGIDQESAKAKYEELQKLQNEGQDKIASDTKEMTLNQLRIKEIEEEKKNIAARRNIVEVEKQARDQERKNLKEQKAHDREMEMRRRQWTLEDRQREDEERALNERMRNASRTGNASEAAEVDSERLTLAEQRRSSARDRLEAFLQYAEGKTGKKRDDVEMMLKLSPDDKSELERLEGRLRESEINLQSLRGDIADREKAMDAAATERERTLADRRREDEDLAHEMRMRAANRVGVQGGQEYLSQERLKTMQGRFKEDSKALDKFWSGIEKRTGLNRTDKNITNQMTDKERTQLAYLEARVREGQRNVASAKADMADVKFAREQREADFRESVSKQSNRLTAMGLGSGDGSSDFGRDTAQNTKELVTLTREMLKRFNGSGTRFGGARRMGAATWAMT